MHLTRAALATAITLLTAPAGATPEIGPVILDNWNKAGCGLTDTIRFSFSAAHDVGLIRTWINWQEGVETVSYTLYGQGGPLRSGTLRRNDCDPYQRSWCQGIDTWNERLPAGRYEIVTDPGRVCENDKSHGNGFIALYEAVAPVARPAAPVARAPSPEAPRPAAVAPPRAALPAPAIPAPQSPSAGTPPRMTPKPPSPVGSPEVTADGIVVGDFNQRAGPFTSDEDEVGDFTNVFATTRGIVKHRPSGAVIVSGHAPPGDLDVALFGLGEDGSVKITIRPCSRSGRVTLFDITGRKLGQTEEVSYGYYGLYASRTFEGLKKGAYALAVEFPDGSLCDDGKNGWTVDVEGHVVDPQPFVGPFETKPDYSVREDLNVDDLVRDLSAIIR